MGGPVGFQGLKRWPKDVGGHRHEDHARARKSFGKFPGEAEAGGEPDPRQKGVVDPVPAQVFQDLGLPDPEADAYTLIPQELGQGGPPAAGADDGHMFSLR